MTGLDFDRVPGPEEPFTAGSGQKQPVCPSRHGIYVTVSVPVCNLAYYDVVPRRGNTKILFIHLHRFMRIFEFSDRPLRSEARARPIKSRLRHSNRKAPLVTG